jgi:signal transduction histidine kinase
VASLNPAAETIFALPARQVKGRPVRELLPAYPEGWQPIKSGTESELSLSPGGITRSYRLAISLLNDWRGQEAGRVLLLRDVTEQKQAQAQLLEQQQALAMLHEREQLARELHDSTGQVLGFAGFQIEAVQDRLQDSQMAISAGEPTNAYTQLTQAQNELIRLSSVIEEAHADLREYILNLRLSPSDQRPFFATLRHYLDGFSQNYGIQADLSVAPGIDDEAFDPQAQMQLFRIVQEALSNARKHARASCVQVSFEMQDSLRRITIQDNGQGFDPAQQHSDGKHHFGLRFMQERAETLGGSLQVDSILGQGTRVMIDVPVGSRKDAKDAKKLIGF